MKNLWNCAAAALTLGLMSAHSAEAAVVTDLVTFSTTGSYAITAPSNYESGAASSGSFYITLDPSLNYLSPSTADVVPLSFSLVDPRFSPSDITSSFGRTASWEFANGVLKAGNALGVADLTGLDDILVTITGLAGGNAGVSVAYSQIGASQIFTSSGVATISAVPLPGALPMFAGTLAALCGWALSRRRAIGGSMPG